ncbi:MAG: 5-carboxymethyl-2-hydroxymuconate Delta-isomerase [Parashewanella sp.]
MPHCIIEHSDEFNPTPLIEAVLKAALASRLFQSKDIKLRAQGFRDYQIGFKRSAFIHVTLKILSGRNDEQKLQLSRLVIEQLASLGYEQVTLTAEVIDIDKNSYSKEVM